MKLPKVLDLHRTAIRQIVESQCNRNARSFVSVEQGCGNESSDFLDILINPIADTTPPDIGAIRYELHRRPGVLVNVLTQIKQFDQFRNVVLAQALLI